MTNRVMAMSARAMAMAMKRVMATNGNNTGFIVARDRHRRTHLKLMVLLNHFFGGVHIAGKNRSLLVQ